VEYTDYYATLGVPKTATQKEISAAFRRLARQHHPDVNKDPKAGERFKKINEANQVLGDPAKRAKYDQLGADWQRIEREGAYRQAQPRGRTATAEGFGDFSDFFRTFFGGEADFRGAGEEVAATGRDLESEIEVTLEEAAQGGRRTIQMEVPQTCPTCQGRGTVGEERKVRGRVVITGTTCSTCGGEGVVSRRRQLDVKIPAGVADGSRIRVRGEGGRGATTAGDLYLRVRLLPHPVFTVEGRDLRRRLPVRDYDAALGAEITVPTLNGSVSMRIPAGTQGGKVFRLRGKGLPALSGGAAGDLYITVDLTISDRLTDEARGLYEKLRALDHKKS
jgi:DnaJ-class molecular chaperone